MSVDTDLAAMLTGFDSQTVVVGSVTTRGILEEADALDADTAGDPVLVRRTVLKVRRSLFSSTPARDTTVTIGGVAYKVADVRVGGGRVGRDGDEIDGRELHLIVRKV